MKLINFTTRNWRDGEISSLSSDLGKSQDTENAEWHKMGSHPYAHAAPGGGEWDSFDPTQWDLSLNHSTL